MVFAAIALVCCVTAFPNSSNATSERSTPAVASAGASTSAAKVEKSQPVRPDAPIAKNVSLVTSNGGGWLLGKFKFRKHYARQPAVFECSHQARHSRNLRDRAATKDLVRISGSEQRSSRL